MAKKKSESLNFYPDLFMGGVWRMSFEERGAYITLLCLSFSERLNLQDIQQVLGRLFETLWPRISCKFQQDENGKFFNERWELEKEQRSAYMERMRENGSKGGRPRKSENNQQVNQQVNLNDNLKQNLNDNHIDRIGYNSSTTEDSYKEGSTALSYQGGAGGISKHRTSPEFNDALYLRFVSAYGETGRPPKRHTIQRALLTAMDHCMDNGIGEMETATFLCSQARATAEKDAIYRNKRMNAETWLDEKCYESKVLPAVVVNEKESPSAKMKRQMEEKKDQLMKGKLQ